jgi:hypothetical protein
MKTRRRLPKAESMRTLIVAAGGFSVGGLLMAGGLTFHSSHLLNDRINLQGQGSADTSPQDQPDQPRPTGQAALAAVAPVVPQKAVESKSSTTSSSTTSSSTSHLTRAKSTTAARTTRRPVYRQAVPAVPKRYKAAPPAVKTSGS